MNLESSKVFCKLHLETYLTSMQSGQKKNAVLVLPVNPQVAMHRPGLQFSNLAFDLHILEIKAHLLPSTLLSAFKDLSVGSEDNSVKEHKSLSIRIQSNFQDLGVVHLHSKSHRSILQVV